MGLTIQLAVPKSAQITVNRLFRAINRLNDGLRTAKCHFRYNIAHQLQAFFNVSA